MNTYKKLTLLAITIGLVCLPVTADNGQNNYMNEAGEMFANLPGGVTSIKEIRNRTSHEVIVRKTDYAFTAAGPHIQEETIPSRGVFNGDFWIPWADNADQFSESHLTISVNGTVIAWIWQSGEYVRFNTIQRFINNARVVPGISRSGGNRRLIVTEASAGRFAIRFERYE